MQGGYAGGEGVDQGVAGRVGVGDGEVGVGFRRSPAPYDRSDIDRLFEIKSEPGVADYQLYGGSKQLGCLASAF